MMSRLLLLGALLATTATATATAGAAITTTTTGAAAPWDVAIGRRPYIAEATGQLLLQLSPAVLGKPLTVTAELPSAKAAWNWTLATKVGTEEYILPFPLGALPKLLNNDMIINVTGAATGSLRRRFGRAWKENATNTAQVYPCPRLPLTTLATPRPLVRG